MKSTVDQIRERFDAEVDRFDKLETGQVALIDAPLMLELVAQAAAASTPRATRVLDIGCGAGNYTLKLLQALPNLDVTLVDLSQRMLDRAVERVGAATAGTVTAVQADVRSLALGADDFDIILASAVLHHMRTDAEWEDVLSKCYVALRPGGSLWIADLISHSTDGVEALMWQRYGAFLEGYGGPDYRAKVFGYVEREDTPKPLLFQVDVLRAVGFSTVEILHKNSCFAAFGAVKTPEASV